MEFAFHTRLDGLDTCRALSRTSAGVARNARKARRGMLLCAANADDSKLSLLTVDSDMEDGCEIG